MAEVDLVCRCGRSNLFSERVPFRAECEQCGGELHSCRYCRFFSPGRQNDCAEPQAEPVREKDRNNRCAWFQPRSGAASEERSGPDPKAELEALFGGKK